MKLNIWARNQFSSYFSVNRVKNSNDDFSQLSFDVYYVTVAEKLKILEKKLDGGHFQFLEADGELKKLGKNFRKADFLGKKNLEMIIQKPLGRGNYYYLFQ